MQSFIKFGLISLTASVLLFLLFYFGTEAGFYYSLADAVVSSTTFALMSFGLSYQNKFIKHENDFDVRFYFIHFFSALVFVSVWSAIVQFALFNIGPFKKELAEIFNKSLLIRLVSGLMGYSIVTAFQYLAIYYNKNLEQIESETRLKNLITEAELKNLKFQINPHFIFNSLNSISALTMIDPEKANKMTLKLASFLRATLHDNNTKFHTLAEELNVIKEYIEIEKIRFEEKFVLTEKIDSEALQIEVPNLIIQPIVENAIKYGVYENLGESIVNLSIIKNNDFVTIAIMNNVENCSKPKNGANVGLNNIKERLKLVYRRDDLIKIESNENSFTVVIYIPIEISEL